MTTPHPGSRFRGRRPPLALVAALMTCLTACGGGWSPLAEPLPTDRQVAAGLHIALSSADLNQAAATIWTLTGKQVAVAAAPVPLPQSDHVLGGFSAVVQIAAVTAQWQADGALQAVATLQPQTVALSVGRPGEAACALHWQAGGAVAQVTAVVTAVAGVPSVALAAAPTVQWQDGQLVDADGCLAPLAADTGAFVDAAVRAALTQALTPRVSDALVQFLQAAVPPSLALAGTKALPLSTGQSLQLGVQARLGSAPASQMERQGGFAVAAVDVAVDVERAACAVDAPPPGRLASPVLKPAAVPASPAVLRRALVVDAALLEHLAWAWSRAGGLCRASSASLSTGLPANWATTLAPSLQDWVDAAPSRARLWPHAAVQLAWVNDAEGPLLRWSLADATLEVAADVGGVESVVLTVRGRLQGTLRPTVVAGGGLNLVHHAASFDSAVVASPLYAEAPGAPSSAGLSTLVNVAVQSLFTPAVAVPISELLPTGTVVTGLALAGGDLWVWLDGGLTAAP